MLGCKVISRTLDRFSPLGIAMSSLRTDEDRAMQDRVGRNHLLEFEIDLYLVDPCLHLYRQFTQGFLVYSGRIDLFDYPK